MTQTPVYHLHPLGPWALGDGDTRSTPQRFARSDTLGVALMAMHALMEAPEHDAADWRPEAIPVSSAFPLVGTVRCFPRPVEEPSPRGRLSAWLSEGVLRERAFGRRYESADYRFGPGWTLEALTTEAFPVDAKVLIEDRPRREIDRLNAQTRRDLFTVHRFQSCGFWFLAQVRDEAQRERLEARLALLGEQGLGGLRGLGCGRFRFERVAWNWPFAPSARALLLSLCLPDHERAPPGEASGMLRWCARKIVWGPQASFQRRATVLAEGSWLSVIDGAPPPGAVVTLSGAGQTSTHAVPRPYLTVALPWPTAQGSAP